MTLDGFTWNQVQTSSTGIRAAMFVWGGPTYVSYYRKGSPTVYYYGDSYNLGDPYSGSWTQLYAEINWFEQYYTSTNNVNYYSFSTPRSIAS